MFPTLLTLATLANPAHADERAFNAVEDGVFLGPVASREEIASVNRKWRGVGIGIDSGFWGKQYASGLKVDVPFGSGRLGQFAGVRLRTTTMFTDDPTVSGFSPTNGAGVELFGRGPVMLGVLRVYGGGGVHMGIGSDHEPAIGGGGHYGIEAMVAPRASFTFEVGGQGGPGALDAADGASVMAGLTVYLGDLGRK